MPGPDAVWIALAIVIWALALALGAKAREAFIGALERLCAEQDTQRRIVTLANVRRRNGRRHADMSQTVGIAVAFINRIVAELRAARG